jgi:hypothetical protein
MRSFHLHAGLSHTADSGYEGNPITVGQLVIDRRTLAVNEYEGNVLVADADGVGNHSGCRIIALHRNSFGLVVTAGHVVGQRCKTGNINFHGSPNFLVCLSSRALVDREFMDRLREWDAKAS